MCYSKEKEQTEKTKIKRILPHAHRLTHIFSMITLSINHFIATLQALPFISSEMDICTFKVKCPYADYGYKTIILLSYIFCSVRFMVDKCHNIDFSL